MDKILDNEIYSSWKDTMKKRASSSLYGTFVLYWLIFHWNFVYTLFFVSEDIIWNSMNLFKNDYLVKIFFNYTEVSFYLFWVLPIIFTWLTIWIFPEYIVIPAFKKEEENETRKSIIKLEEQKKIIKSQSDLESATQEKINIVEENLEKEKKLKEVTTTTWGKELDLIKTNPMFSRFKQIIDAVYGNNGRTHKLINNSWTRILPYDVVAFADTRGLINLHRSANQLEETIDLTEKGKFFAESIY